jgi:hypothetical protein
MSRSPLSLTVSPLRTVLPTGKLHATEHVTVRDSGSSPLTIRTGSLTVSQTAHGCGVSDLDGWLTASPSVLHLKPGEARQITVTVSAPQTATGTTDLAALITATGTASNGSTISGAVGSQVVITATGTTQAPVCGHQVKALPAAGGSGGIPASGLVLLAVVVAVTATFITLFVRGLRRNRRARRVSANIS